MDHLSLIPEKEIECIQQAVKAYQDVNNYFVYP